ncbi:tyrosine-type recombinase/integrase [Enterococcus pernyi]
MATFKQYEKKDGSKAWLFQAYLGIDQLTGKEIRTTRRNFRTKKEAQLALSRLQVDFENNGLENRNDERFKEVYELWLEVYRSTIKEVTLIKTEIKFNKWILPVYGNMKIKDVTTKHCQKIINQWAKETDQYRVLHSSASRIFKYAINLGIIATNPLANVMMPKRKKELSVEEPIKVYSKEQVVKLFDHLNHRPSTYTDDFNKTLLRFLVYSGCRISEALALNWSDINFTDKSVVISKTLSHTKNGLTISSPKTENSYGEIALDDQTINILKRWQMNQRIHMLEYGKSNPKMIFCNVNKQYVSHNSFYARLKNITKNAGVPFLGNHVTRHTHASMLLDAGASMKEIQERLRHSSITITMDVYGHLSKETKANTVEKLVKHLNF